VWTSSIHPQANGQVERTHSVVMATLMTLGEAETRWAKLLPEVQRLMNHSETKVTGKTPFEMLHGYRPRFYKVLYVPCQPLRMTGRRLQSYKRVSVATWN